MLAYTRGTIATAERELRKCIENLRVPIKGECSIDETATRMHYALSEAENALRVLGEAVELEEKLDAALPAYVADLDKRIEEARERREQREQKKDGGGDER